MMLATKLDIHTGLTIKCNEILYHKSPSGVASDSPLNVQSMCWIYTDTPLLVIVDHVKWNISWKANLLQ